MIALHDRVPQENPARSHLVPRARTRPADPPDGGRAEVAQPLALDAPLARAVMRESGVARDRHRRDLRPVFPDTPDDSGNENEDGEDGAVLRPKIDPSTIIADLDSDRGVREANEELEASSRHPDTTMSDSDPSSADGVTMTKIASHAATAGNGFLPTMDGPLQSIGPPSEDSSRTFNNAVEELDAEKTVACRNHLNPRHCADMVARTGCEQWVKMESTKKYALFSFTGS